jgi:hypothetical protein
MKLREAECRKRPKLLLITDERIRQECNSKFISRLSLFCLVLFFISLISCHRVPENVGPKYSSIPNVGSMPSFHLAVHPLFNPSKRLEADQPLIDCLNKEFKCPPYLGGFS